MEAVELSVIINYDKSSSVAEIGDCLATIDMRRKLGGAVPLSEGGVSWVPI